MAAPDGAEELVALLRTTPAASVPPASRALIRADDGEPVGRALGALAAARVLSCPVYSRSARRYTALLDAMDVAVAVLGAPAGDGERPAALSAVLKRPAGAVANTSGANAFVGLDATAPLAVAVSVMAGPGAYRLALVEPGGGGSSTSSPNRRSLLVNGGGALVGKLSPADVRALLGGVVAAAAAGDGAAVDAALDAALAVGLGDWLTGQGVTTTARSSAPAAGAPPPAADGAVLKALPAGVSVAANALTVAPSTRLAALVDALVATGQHHAFVLAEEGGGLPASCR
ncbi:hypothetical protein BU14_0294s0011 [Porphyra umbilicalis]|uniref:CBS domain-containing protein n=1 Tax=Porphyra umbilicalis TaxID=2786 RepID=A0A1X6P0N4_PORUM|nr:hypothetical protein BU14_0294s0011 [Porphyra umbilicalis]|eukprot:OSX74320.1 hypothetical protein BU14_0294s0011 [Porphyra umbilicalis]